MLVTTATLAAAKGATVVADPPASTATPDRSRPPPSPPTARPVTCSSSAPAGTAAGGPGFTADRLPPRPAGAGRSGWPPIDHVVGNVEKGRLDDWVAWYIEVLGFAEMRHFDADQISTQYSALRSTVVHNGAGIVMPINEPAPGLKKSQIDEYLEAYRGPGVQHIALATPGHRDRGRRHARARGPLPADARDLLRGRQAAGRRASTCRGPTSQRLDIEVDVDTGGYLLQIFTETVTDRPTLFVEIIQREGATGFGEGNFKALFEAIEREQARRGNL